MYPRDGQRGLVALQKNGCGSRDTAAQTVEKPLFCIKQNRGSLRVSEKVDIRPLGEFCVSVFRQNQEYHVFNVHDEGLFPLVNFLPAGWNGMRAAGGVNAGSLCREYYFKGISLPCGRRT